MPSAKIYYDSDADVGLLSGKQIVFLGFGNQGAAQAQNLRDSGIPNDKILIANREDSYADDAKAKGFIVEHNFEKAAAVADVLFLLIPDQAQPRVFNGTLVAHLKPNATIVVASGYNVLFKLLQFNPTHDVVMVAPRMIGSSVRSLYEKGKGFPCFVSVEQDGSGNALPVALALSKVIGATKAGAIASSAREETIMDLLAEQALWPNIIMLFREAFNVLQKAGCSDEALCYEMWMSKEPAEIFDRAAEEGFITQLKHHSTCSQFGQLRGALNLDGAAARSHFEDVLYNQILSGKFSKEFSQLEDDLEKEGEGNPLNELYRRTEESELAQAEKRVRARLAYRIHDYVITNRDGQKHEREIVVIQPTLYAPEGPSVRPRGSVIGKRETDGGIVANMKSVEKGAVAGITVIVLETDTGTGTATGRGVVSETARGPTAAGEDTAVTVNGKEIVRIVTGTEDANVTVMRSLRVKNARSAGDPTRTSTTRMVALYTALVQPTETVLPIEDLEVGLLSIHETNSMIHPDIEGTGITVVERARVLLEMRMNIGNVVTELGVPYPLLGIRLSPSYEVGEDYNPDEPKEDDSEARSVFVSQLAARLTARDLGYFFEDKLGEGTVMDARIVTDRLSRRSKGIGYVEFRTIDLVEKAMALTGTVVMGLPIMVQLTEAERNKTHAGDGSINLPPGVSAPHGAILYVGSLHFNLTESDIKQVFEVFGELEFVDLHRDPMTGRSKGYAFIQYKRAEDARMALQQMEGFELAGRTASWSNLFPSCLISFQDPQLRVNTVHEKGTAKYTQQDSLDESGGGNLNAASRQALMQKLARTDQPVPRSEPAQRPNIPQSMQSRSVLLKNMFDADEEIEKDWDKDLAEDVKGECEGKYGKVLAIKVERDSQGEIYVKFDSVESAKKAIQGLNGRWFGGRQVSAVFISDAIMQAHQ
ncbi:RNA-binding protein rsd1 [Leucoagaricus sp. SymC.cos]|nr:RNA-binding protein rsd1 [Leucoagaricus sp. SymC.cos]